MYFSAALCNSNEQSASSDLNLSLEPQPMSPLCHHYVTLLDETTLAILVENTTELTSSQAIDAFNSQESNLVWLLALLTWLPS